MNIRFALPEFKIENTRDQGHNWQRIVMDHAAYKIESGVPDLPSLSFSIAIPDQRGVQVEMSRSATRVIQDFIPYPAQDDIRNGEIPPFNMNEALYQGRNTYPENVISHSQPMIMRDLRIISVQVSPFVWNPVSRQLTIHDEIDLRVRFTSDPGINGLTQSTPVITPLWAKQYEALVLNFDDYRNYVVTNAPPRYLVIHGNFVNSIFEGYVNDFVFWKRQKGADVDVVSTAVTGTQNTQIKTFIQNRYNNPATRPDYIILIGDTTGNFFIPTWTVSSGAGDYPYTHLAGGDGLGDCFIGRISAENNDQLATLMNKIYVYEKNINPNQASWLNHMLLVGHWGNDSGISTVYVNKYIKETALQYNPNYTFTELYGQSPSSAAMNAAINQGVSFFNYRGWLGMSGWSPNDANLFNGTKLPHGVFLTCSTGNFNQTATTESFIRLGTTTSPKGGVTAIGMATSSTHTLYNNTLDGGIFAGLFTHHMRTMGEALLHSKLYLNQIYGVSQVTGSTNSAHWCNLMGDPTLDVWIGIPIALQMDVLSNVPLGYSLLDVYVTDILDRDVEGACVTLSQGTSILSRGWTDSEGHVILDLPTGVAAGVAVITVSKPNHKPLQQTINFDNSGTLVPGIIAIDDDNIGGSNGNNNGLVNAGEMVQINFALRNTSTAPRSGVSGIMTCNSPFVTIINGNVTYPTITAGAQAFSHSPVLIQLSPNTPDGYTIRIRLILSDSASNQYDISEFVMVYNARLGFVSYLIYGTSGVLNPGDSSELRVTTSNIGSSAVSNVYGELISMNPLLAVIQNTAYYGSFNVGSQLNHSPYFQVYARPLLVPGMVIPMQLRLYNSQGFVQVVNFSITIGSVTVNDPLGPDAYGYLIYDDQDSGYDARPTYNWIGIAPHENGRGIHLSNINDYYTSSDEGDQIGVISLQVVNLPFAFRMYGRPYTQITVCSNGFIALGVSENPEFRNFRLPGAMGPSPMIAGFWDDLAIGTGSGIYWWYNRSDNSVIVQWDQMRSGFNGTSIVTFQVILYDPAFHATPTGDGPIKIQYKTFNNVNMSSGIQHGNYCTIGIENHDQTIGLEYTYNNTYPTAASPLGHERAIYITTVPVIQQPAIVTIDNVYVFDDNNNQLLEPGESVNLSIKLSNNGLNSAINVNAILSSSDPYITINGNSAGYGTISGLATAFGSNFYAVSVAAAAPHNHEISFTLNITSGAQTWTRTFSLRVQRAALVFHSRSYDDFALNNNGLIDPGETGKIQINVFNESLLKAENVLVTLSESSPHISFANTSINCGEILGRSIFQAVTQVVVSPATPQGTTIPITVNITSSNAEPHNAQFDLTVGVMNYFWNFEANNGGFTVINTPSPGWEWGTSSYAGAFSGSRVWGTVLNANYADNATYQLFSPHVTIGSQSQLKFWHRYEIEPNYDGGQVSISTDNGSTWQIITPQGGYPHQNLPALGGPGYHGTLTTWQEAVFNLGSFANQAVRFRWVFKSDGSVTRRGWFIDDVQITQAAGASDNIGKISGLVSIDPSQPSIVPLISIGIYTVRPAVNGTYEIIVPPGNYTIKGLHEGYRSSTTNLQVQNQNTYTQNISLTQMRKPDGLTWAITDNSIHLRWNNISEPDLTGYRVYRKIGTSNWQSVAILSANHIVMSLSGSGVYDYRISAVYIDNWESLPTGRIRFIYPYNGFDVQPLNPQNITLTRTGNTSLLAWDPVTQDTDGNAITVWAYRVYADNTPDFAISPANLLSTIFDTNFMDHSVSNIRFYKVVALIGYIDLQ